MTKNFETFKNLHKKNKQKIKNNKSSKYNRFIQRRAKHKQNKQHKNNKKIGVYILFRPFNDIMLVDLFQFTKKTIVFQ